MFSLRLSILYTILSNKPNSENSNRYRYYLEKLLNHYYVDFQTAYKQFTIKKNLIWPKQIAIFLFFIYLVSYLQRHIIVNSSQINNQTVFFLLLIAQCEIRIPFLENAALKVHGETNLSDR